MIDFGAGLPDPNDPYPIRFDGVPHKGTVFLKPLVTQENFRVGAYTYASEFAPPEDWARHLAPYLYAGSKDALVIGKFCAIAAGTKFVTSGANHAMDGLTTYPFPIFEEPLRAQYAPDRHATTIGHDVWLGMNTMVLAGAQIGHGAVIGASSVVRGEIPDYAIAYGNPARVQRMRFAPDVIEALLDLAWWDWPPAKIAEARPALLSGDLQRLQELRD